MNNIEVIEDNGGGLTIQSSATKAVAHFQDKRFAIESLKAITEGDNMSGWELSAPECYITDEEYRKHEASGGYRAWSEDEILAQLAEA